MRESDAILLRLLVGDPLYCGEYIAHQATRRDR
jgi:bifunctional DNase/RNase